MSAVAEEVTDQLAAASAHFDCFSISLHLWGGRKQLQGAKVMLNDTQVASDKITTPQAILLPPEWSQKFNVLTSAKNRLIEQHTLPHITPTLACVMRFKTPEFLQKLNALAAQVTATRTELQDNWESVVAWNRDRWGERFEDYRVDGELVAGMKHFLPKPESLSKRIKLTWTILAVTAGMETAREVENAEMQELMDRTREMTRARINEFVEGLVAAPRQRLAEAIANLQSMVARNATISDASFNKLRAAIALATDFQRIPATTDTELMTNLRELQHVIENAPRRQNNQGVTLQSLDIAAIGETLTSTMERVVARCQDENILAEQVAAMGGGRRLSF